jgi:phosphate transport system substrate-binding protein
MRKNMRFKLPLLLSAIAAFAALSLQIGCGRKSEDGGASGEKMSIQNSGSDTMVNLAQAWAEAYAEVDPSVSVEVSGGGSGTGIAALINGTVDIANSSRKIEPEELEKAKQNTGKEPIEYLVGYDALAVYVHKDNPMNEITIEQLAEIFGEGGKIEKWSQLGVTNSACDNDQIIRISRQSNSGTYHYFREAILGKNRDFKLGSSDMNGSKDVVAAVSQAPCALGYSGLGYHTSEVKMLLVAKKAGDPTYAPSIETTLNHTYPIARPLFVYSLGTPNEQTKKYLDWIHSVPGQVIVKESGYVPLPEFADAVGATPAKE